MDRIYLTTPLYYVNDKPHLGTAYTTVMTDILNRYFKLFGHETIFLTGTDEHGQKCQQAAQKNNLPPQAYCDQMVENFKAAWTELEVEYDIFYRTTDENHKTAVGAALQRIHDKGEIYSSSYEGWYSVSEEIFYTEKDLVNGKSPTGNEVQKLQEKAYFFKMSLYQERLIEHIEKHPEFIAPESKRNEVLGFLRKPLEDLCISRPKSRLHWGIEFPFDTDYVTYVWFDALLNYAVAVGLLQKGREREFATWWPETHHILGKDIITTHAVYWTTMLMALEVPLPKKIFAHGWILNKELGKMSKSRGDVVDPLKMKDVVGIEPLRYWFARDIHFGNDAPFTQDLLIGRINNDLANNIGNTLSRTSNLIEKYFSSKVPAPLPFSEKELELQNSALALAGAVKKHIQNFAPSLALEAVFQLLNENSKYLEEAAPWKTVKEDPTRAGTSLYLSLEILRICAVLLSPALPKKMNELLRAISVEKWDFSDTTRWGLIAPGAPVKKAPPLFPRVESPKI